MLTQPLQKPGTRPPSEAGSGYPPEGGAALSSAAEERGYPDRIKVEIFDKRQAQWICFCKGLRLKIYGKIVDETILDSDTRFMIKMVDVK